MCLAAFAIHASSRWPLVLASNRDEFFDRPALALSSWQTAGGQRIVSGRDVQAGGSWLGMSPEGRVALLTNVREGSPQPGRQSRGELVIDWLGHSGDAISFAKQINPAFYGGFNLVLGDLPGGHWHVWSNRPEGTATAAPQRLADGIYGLSNAALDSPWPKTLALKSALTTALVAPSQAELELILWQALRDPTRAAVGALPHTGVPRELEHALSSAHVSLPERNYGTRCASVIVVNAQSHPTEGPSVGDVTFKERSFKDVTLSTHAAQTTAEVNFSLPLRAARHPPN